MLIASHLVSGDSEQVPGLRCHMDRAFWKASDVPSVVDDRGGEAVQDIVEFRIVVTQSKQVDAQASCPHMSQMDAGALGEVYNPYTQPQMNDPFSVWEVARASKPVFYSNVLDAWVVTKHAMVQAVLNDAATFQSGGLDAIRVHPDDVKEILSAIPNQAAPLRALDEPDHMRRRKLTQAAVTPKRVNQLEPKIREIANRLIDGFYADGKADFYDAFAYRFPLAVACSFLGFSDEDAEKLHYWANCRVMLAWGRMEGEQYRDVARGVVAMSHFIEGEIVKRQAEPRDDVITDMIRINQELPQPSTLPEMVEDVHTLIVAGHESTATFITLALFHLLETDQWGDLCANPSTISKMIEEALRFDGPVLGLWRIATSDTTIGDAKISAGQRVYVTLGSSNRDEEVFKCPAQFDPARPDARAHMSFGRGPHTCIGATLARHEAKIAFEILAERLAHIRLSTADTGLTFGANATLRLPQALNVEWDV